MFHDYKRLSSLNIVVKVRPRDLDILGSYPRPFPIIFFLFLKY